MEEDFENHKDVVWFHTLGEGLDLIRYYLDHDAEREEIAWNGWRRAMEAHTFEHRLAEFEHAVGGAL
jgi:spore maturation protein CgeB